MECGPFVPNLLTGLEMYLLGPCRRGQDVVLEVQPVTNGKLQRFFLAQVGFASFMQHVPSPAL